MKTATQNFSRAKFQAVQGNYRRTDLDTCLNKLLTKNIEFAVRMYLMQKSCYQDMVLGRLERAVITKGALCMAWSLPSL